MTRPPDDPPGMTTYPITMGHPPDTMHTTWIRRITWNAVTDVVERDEWVPVFRPPIRADPLPALILVVRAPSAMLRDLGFPPTGTCFLPVADDRLIQSLYDGLRHGIQERREARQDVA